MFQQMYLLESKIGDAAPPPITSDPTETITPVPVNRGSNPRRRCDTARTGDEGGDDAGRAAQRDGVVAAAGDRPTVAD